jgi:hypothetical protein
MQEWPELVALRGGAGSSVESAMSLLRSEWPFAHLAPAMPPLALMQQIYFLLPQERTRVDRELATLQAEGRVRVLKLSALTAESAGSQDDELAVVRSEDYEAAIRAIMPPPSAVAAAAVPSTLAQTQTADGRGEQETQRRVDADSAAVAAQTQAPARLSRPASVPSPAASTATASAALALPVARAASAHGNVATNGSANSAAAFAPTTFAPWPSSSSSSSSSAPASTQPSRASSAVLSTNAAAALSGRPPRAPSALPAAGAVTGIDSDDCIIVAAASPAASSATGAGAVKEQERIPLRRKRSQPMTTSAQNTAAAATAAAAADSRPVTARAASADGRVSKKPRLADGAAASISLSAGGTPRRGLSSAAPAAASAASSSSSSLFPSDLSNMSTHTQGVNPKLHLSLRDVAPDERFPATLDTSHASYFAAEDTRVLLQLFLLHVLPACSKSLSITQEELLDLCYTPHRASFRQGMRAEQTVSALLHFGLLVFRSSSSFYLAAPGAARLLSALRAGRKELVTLVKKRQYKEMPLRDALALQKLKTSPCQPAFHLRDMLGSERLLQMQETTMGPLLKIASDR